MGAVIALAYLPISYELTRVGAVHPLFLIATVASLSCLLVGGVLTFMRRRNVVYLLAVACAFALGALIFWRSIFTIAHAIFAATSAVQGFYVFRPARKKP